MPRPEIDALPTPMRSTRPPPGSGRDPDPDRGSDSASDSGRRLEYDPDDEARSRELSARIVSEIRASGGWIGFDRYMHRALYEPGLGYYASGRHPFGAGGDFVTAPELSPLFAQALATQLADWLPRCGSRVIEFGAGSGALCAGLLQALGDLDAGSVPGALPAEYWIVEVSATLRERQRQTLTRDCPAWADRVRWLDTLPARVEGVVLANEVLDALPVRVFEWTQAGCLEMGVRLARDDDGAPALTQGPGCLGWSARPADPAWSEPLEAYLRAAGLDRRAIPQSAGPWSYRSEWPEQVRAWIRTVGASLARGVILLIDYGFPAREFYHPQRRGGTLMCHRRHRAHPDPFAWPGLQDITAHVDFTAVAQAAQSVGLEVLGYTTQADWLIGCGLLDRLSQIAACASPAQRARATAGVQTLLSEAEMGELFKVMALVRAPASDFDRAPLRRYRLDRHRSLGLEARAFD